MRNSSEYSRPKSIPREFGCYSWTCYSLLGRIRFISRMNSTWHGRVSTCYGRRLTRGWLASRRLVNRFSSRIPLECRQEGMGVPKSFNLARTHSTPNYDETHPPTPPQIIRKRSTHPRSLSRKILRASAHLKKAGTSTTKIYL